MAGAGRRRGGRDVIPSSAKEEGPLLQVRGLKMHFPVRGGVLGRRTGWIKAVDGVSFDLEEGETLGLVGESGAGKSTAAKALLRLLEPTGGEVLYRGRAVGAMDRRELRRFRRRVQIILQDSAGAFNPRLPVGRMLDEVLRVHGLGGDRRGRRRRIADLLEMVGLGLGDAGRLPHEFSGGQRQRLGIARALSVEPELLVCDEPVSALDVSVQAQVVNLLTDLQGELGLSCLFIAHDLGVVRLVSDRVAVMYLGRIVETGPTAALYRNARHPYTRALLSAHPRPEPSRRRRRDRIVLKGDPPSPGDPPPGCPFHPRCWHPARDAECRGGLPPFERVGKEHYARCIKLETLRENRT